MKVIYRGEQFCVLWQGVNLKGVMSYLIASSWHGKARKYVDAADCQVVPEEVQR